MDQLQKKLVIDSFRCMKKFVIEFQGNELDEKSLTNLHFELECNTIGLPVEIAEKILSFTQTTLDPMVYEYDTVFENHRPIGQMFNDMPSAYAVEDGIRFFTYFYTTLAEIKEKLDYFGQTELRPYLMTE